MYDFIKKLIPISVKGRIKLFIKNIKTKSIYELNYKESFKAHNEQMGEKDAFQKAIEIHNLKSEHTVLREGKWNNLYCNNSTVGYFLDSNHKIENLIDIGSGTGWFVHHVEKNHKKIKKIIAVEPSKFGIEIAKKIHSKSNIVYLNDFIDSALNKISPDVYIVTTFAVFQHLPKRYTRKVLKKLSKILKSGSYLFFNEPIATSYLDSFRMHYPRKEKFWKKNLKGFSVEFNKQNIDIIKAVKL